MVNIVMSNMSLDKRWCRLELRDYIRPESRVTVFGFEMYQEKISADETWEEFYDKRAGAFYDYITDPFAFFGIAAKSIKWINYTKDTAISAKRKIQSSDALIFTDGKLTEMMKIIDSMELTDTIKNYKGVIIGFGMGGLIQCRDNLRLVDNIDVKISFDEMDYDFDELKKEAEDSKIPIYGITDDGAVVSDNGKIHTLGDVYIIE